MNAANRLVSRIVIAGSQQAIWRELTKQGEPQQAVFNAWLHAQSLQPGARLQMRTGSGKTVIVIGEVIEYDPPNRFAHTFRFTQYDDPECTVTYELKPVDGGIEVTLTVDNLPLGTRSAKDMTRGATMILETLKAVVETGKPKFATRLMYALFSKMEFMLPARCAAKNWPL